MATKTEHLIDSLHRISLTRRVDYSENAKLNGLATSVCAAPSRAINFPSWSDDDIRDFSYFMISICDAPSSLRGLLLIETALSILIRELLKRVEATDELKIETTELMREFFDNMYSAPDSDRDIFRRSPLMYESPLFYFLNCSYKYSLIRKNPDYCPLFEAYALKFYIAIRYLEHQKPSNSTHETRLLVSRHFFEFLPDCYKSIPAEQQPDIIPADYFRAAFENFSRSYGKDDGLTETAATYLFYTTCLLAKSPLRKRRTSEKSGRSADTDEDNKIYPDDHSEGLLISSDEQVSDTGDDDYPLPLTLADSLGDPPLADTMPSIPQSWAELIHLRNFIFYWNYDNLNLFHYSILYYVLDNIDDEMEVSLWEVVAVYLYIEIHTGLPPKLLINLSWDGPEGASNHALLIREGDRYFISMPLMYSGAHSTSKAHCRRTHDRVLIPMPTKLCQLISTAIPTTTGQVFRYWHKRRLKKLDLDMVRQFINKKVNRHPLFAKYDLHITAVKLHRSFPALYMSRYGLDPIMCTYIKADKRERLYKSQAHYTFIARSDIERQYLATFSAVDCAIIANVERCIEQGIIPAKSFGPIMTSLPLTAVHPLYMDEGYGSSILPSYEHISSTIQALVNAILNTTDILLKFNLFCIYTYLCNQHACGMRPHKIPQISPHDYAFSRRLMIVRDKDSATYFEERFLPLPSVLVALLKTLKRGNFAVRRQIELNIRPGIRNEPCESMFALFDEKGFPKDFTIMNAVSQLASVGIDYDMRPNMPRHFLRDTLYQHGISNDLIDIIMGHTHAGRELLGIASSSYLDQVTRHCLPVIISMLGRLGFRDIKLWKSANNEH